MHNWRAFSLWSIYFLFIANPQLCTVENEKKKKKMMSTKTALYTKKNANTDTERKTNSVSEQKDVFSIQKIFSFDCLPKKHTFLNCFESLVAVAGKDMLCLQSFNNRNCYYDTHKHTNTQNFLSKMISEHNKMMNKINVIKVSILHLQIFGKINQVKCLS